MNPLPSPSQELAITPAAWSQQIRGGFFPLALHVPPTAAFHARTVVKVRPACRIALVRAGAHTAMMARNDCEGLGRRFTKVLWQLEGVAHLEQHARSVDINPGQWTMYEATRPYEIHMSEGAAFVVMLCESGADDEWPALGSHVAHVAQPTVDSARLALDCVRSALAADVALDQSACAVMAYSVRKFLEIAVRSGKAEPPLVERGAAGRRLLVDAKDYIQRHLSDPALGPDRIAAALRVSRRTLYNAFVANGETPQTYVQHLRLQRGREMLHDPSGTRRSITQVAMELGFNDAAYFSRAFRREFGEPPSSSRSRPAED